MPRSPRPELQKKMKEGPSALLTVWPSSQAGMGSSLVQWLVHCVLVGLCAAYTSGRALEPGAQYLAIFRFVGMTAFLGYAFALLQSSIWFRRSWRATLLSVFDGLIYALLTAGTFASLWPG